MKIIVAGSRSIQDKNLVFSVINHTINKHKLSVKEIISGGAGGVDSLAELFSKENGYFFKCFPANWSNVLNIPKSQIKYNYKGNPYNVRAGFERNQQMAEYADCLISIWDGVSPGSKHMIEIMEKLHKPAFVFNVLKDKL